MTTDARNSNLDDNLDPLSRAPGSHPLGTGVGATGGALAGAVAGALAGPLGAAAGLLIGAVAGGLSGKAVAEGVHPTSKDAYWRENHIHESYYDAGRSYAEYQPAYALGWSRDAADGPDFEAVEPGLAAEWAVRRGSSGLEWPEARLATRAAWDRAGDTAYGVQDSVLTPVGAESGSNADMVDLLNDLLERERDGEYLAQDCATRVQGIDAKALMQARATACRNAGEALMLLIRHHGGVPASGGTATGALQRGWAHLKDAVHADSEPALLEACERAEENTLACYRRALEGALPDDVRRAVQNRTEGVTHGGGALRADE